MQNIPYVTYIGIWNNIFFCKLCLSFILINLIKLICKPCCFSASKDWGSVDADFNVDCLDLSLLSCLEADSYNLRGHVQWGNTGKGLFINYAANAIPHCFFNQSLINFYFFYFFSFILESGDKYKQSPFFLFLTKNLFQSINANMATFHHSETACPLIFY